MKKFIFFSKSEMTQFIESLKTLNPLVQDYSLAGRSRKPEIQVMNGESIEVQQWSPWWIDVLDDKLNIPENYNQVFPSSPHHTVISQ